MINFIKNFWKKDGQESSLTPHGETDKFKLKFKNLEIGFLVLENSIWKFEYSNTFKEQDEIQPLVDFPDIHKIYKSDELWPFFTSRIPGLGQPEVQRIIKKENIDQNNEVSLLKKFGNISITNPFELEAMNY